MEKNIQELHLQLVDYIKENIYSSSMVRRISAAFNRLLLFMKQNSNEIYTREIGEAYLGYRKQYAKKIKSRYNDNRYITLLNGMLENQWTIQVTKRKYDIPFPGDIGGYFAVFLEKYAIERRLKAATRNNYYRSLFKFCERMQYDGILSLKDITAEKILDFMSSIKNCRDNCAIILRAALRELYDEGIIDRRTAKILDNLKTPIRCQVQTYYTSDEILRFERNVNRTTARGKRDYAMILLATRLGLRSSDIRYLQFSSIDWNNNIIRLQQFKTQTPIELPLLIDIGEAIIDYIKNGRPKVKSKYVFLRGNGPYVPISNSALYTSIRKYLKQADINCNGKKNGSHSLRHSFATILLKNKIPIPIISDSLGHSNTAITMQYLHISVENLLECTLDVPPVNKNFYLQANYK